MISQAAERMIMSKYGQGNGGSRLRVPDQLRETIAAEYVSGARSGQLAKKYGINRKLVTTIVREKGFPVRNQLDSSGRPQRATDHLLPLVLELRERGLSQAKIGKKLGVSQALIGRMLIAAGKPTREILNGEKASRWNGGQVINPHGYRMIHVAPDHPFASMRIRTGYVLEHRLVMAERLGRALTPFETVHHINGDRTDNRIENLQLRQGKHGRGVVMVCACCGSGNIVSREID
jgi:DNA-binding CsgD family transcriptional regulator